MNLHGYQVRRFLARYGLPTPVGYTCTTLHRAREAASEIGAGLQVVKCQVYADGRDKAGSVKVVNSKENIRAFAGNWLGKRLVTYQTDASSQPVNWTLVRITTDIVKELYLGAVADRSSRCVAFTASIEGGVEIERAVEGTPRLIHEIALDPLTGPMPYQERKLASKLGLEGKLVRQFIKIFMGLATTFLECDLTLIEISPLVITKRGNLTCPDGKLGAGDNAPSRRPGLREMRDQSQEDPCEAQVAQWEPNYAVLSGNISCVANGVGPAMGAIDIVKLHGGEPVSFLDVGGDATKGRVTEASKIILSDDKMEAVLVNIFGGIIRCDLIVDGIIGAVAEVGINIPVMVRLEGNNAELGVKKLAGSGLNITAARGLMDVAQQVVTAVEGK